MLAVMFSDMHYLFSGIPTHYEIGDKKIVCISIPLYVFMYGSLYISNVCCHVHGSSNIG